MTMPWLRGSDANRRARYTQTTAQLRVSDAERAAVADRLAQHYGDGRLDQAELDDRLGRAMSAKTRADLDGLLADLPEAGPALAPGGPRGGTPEPPRPAAARPRWRLLPLVLVILLVLLAWRVLASWAGPWGPLWPGAWFGLPWLWITLLVFVWLRWGRHRR
jgi:DUF1707 SHOCT-like domain